MLIDNEEKNKANTVNMKCGGKTRLKMQAKRKNGVGEYTTFPFQRLQGTE